MIPSSAHQLFWFHMTTEKSTVKAGAVIYTHTMHRMQTINTGRESGLRSCS